MIFPTQLIYPVFPNDTAGYITQDVTGRSLFRG
jgi:hypothetical protein